MKIKEVLTEAKARIEHPEDRIFDEGSVGAKAALDSLLYSLSSKQVSIKFDGTPALIAGYIDGKFVMTDKAGLAKHQFPMSSKDMFSMIYDRKPDQEGRKEYSNQVANLLPYIQKMIPNKFPGLIQFDVMWFTRPELVNGIKTGEFYQFKPNKVLYNIPKDSELGKEIGQSKYGIVVHSYFDSPDDDEPRGISDFASLGLKPVQGLVVLNPVVAVDIPINKTLIAGVHTGIKYVTAHSAQVDTFFNQGKLKSLKIADLPAVMKKFLSQRAGAGMEVSIACMNDFLSWLNDAELNPDKKLRMVDYIEQHKKEYEVVWHIIIYIVNIKHRLFQILNTQNKMIQASINGQASHEGYVVDSPSGKIKLVNRPLFMRK